MSERFLKHKQVPFKAKTVADDGTFKGYASVFGNVDSYGDIVAPGAFTQSIALIKSSGDPLPILYQHSSSAPIGGSDVLEEDDTGLKTEGWLMVNEIPLAAQAHALMKRRVMKGLSIGYYVEDSSYNEKEKTTTLKTLELVEYSIVTFPANTLAQIDAVKSIINGGRLPSLAEFEDLLRDAGFSKTQAKTVAGHGLRRLLDQSDAEGTKSGEILAALEGFKLPS